MDLAIFDVLLPKLPVLFCGINPNLLAAETGHNFGSPSNRFWRVLHRAGFTPTQLTAAQDRSLLRYGCGITAAVVRGTRSAAELTPADFRSGEGILRAKIEHFQPEIMAFLGKSTLAAITGRKEIGWGPQDLLYGGARVWTLPNPSGLNRNFDLAGLVDAYRALQGEAAPLFETWRQVHDASPPLHPRIQSP